MPASFAFTAPFLLKPKQFSFFGHFLAAERFDILQALVKQSGAATVSCWMKSSGRQAAKHKVTMAFSFNCAPLFPTSWLRPWAAWNQIMAAHRATLLPDFRINMGAICFAVFAVPTGNNRCRHFRHEWLAKAWRALREIFMEVWKGSMMPNWLWSNTVSQFKNDWQFDKL